MEREGRIEGERARRVESGWRATWKSVVGEGWSRGCRCCCALGQTANPGSISPIAMTSRPTHSRDATLAHPRSNHPPPQSRSSAAPQLQRPSHPTFPFSASASPSLPLSMCLSLPLSCFVHVSVSLSLVLSLPRALYASLFLFLSLPLVLYTCLSFSLSLVLYTHLCFSFSFSLFLMLYTRLCVSLCRSTGLLDGRPWSY